MPEEPRRDDTDTTAILPSDDQPNKAAAAAPAEPTGDQSDRQRSEAAPSQAASAPTEQSRVAAVPTWRQRLDRRWLAALLAGALLIGCLCGGAGLVIGLIAGHAGPDRHGVFNDRDDRDRDNVRQDRGRPGDHWRDRQDRGRPGGRPPTDIRPSGAPPTSIQPGGTPSAATS